MPDSNLLLPEKYEQAVAELEEKLFKQLTAHPLSENEIKTAYKSRDFIKGWQITLPFSGGDREINLLVSDEFPSVPPSVALAPPPAPLTYPHIENDGVLCLLPDTASVSPYEPANVVKDLLRRANNLIDDSLAKRNIEDFRDEFYSYWNRALTDSYTKFISLIEPKPPSRIISVWRKNGILVCGENEASLLQWLENSYGKKNYKIGKAVFLWLFRTMSPAEYPRTSDDLYKLAQKQTNNGLFTLNQLVADLPDEINILLGSQTKNGVSVAGMTLRKPQTQNHITGKFQDDLQKGFRQGFVPPATLSARFLRSGMPVGRYEAERADAAWIHGRGVDKKQPDLASSVITVVGCGAVGGAVVKLLAMSGVGKLILIDSDILSRANTGRHVLGAKYAGLYKAQSLALEIKENYPHLSVEFRNENWQKVARQEPELFLSSDAVISAIGDWKAENSLNEWQQSYENFPPVIFGWTEPFAAAGHAVSIFRGQSCFQCDTDEFGEPDFQAAEWQNRETLLQEPACGVMFQPYAPVELNNTITLIAELAIDVLLKRIESPTHRVWACRRYLLESSGGEWTKEWLAATNNNFEGGIVTSKEWVRRDSCQSCGNKKSYYASL